jgi:hypothetical protein
MNHQRNDAFGRSALTTVPKIRLLCPNLSCRKVLAVPGNLRGHTIRCSVCGTSVRVPDRRPQPAPATSDEDQPTKG